MDTVDLLAWEARAIEAEVKIDEARRILIDALPDDGAFSVVSLADAIVQAVEVMGGFGEQ